MLRALLIPAAFLTLSAVTVAQTPVRQFNDQSISGPLERYDHAMTLDYARGEIVLFGGRSLFGFSYGDTWIYKDGVWEQRFPASSPPARAAHGMTYDFKNGWVILFGGGIGAQHFGDTWAWDGTTWQDVTPVGAPGTYPGPRSYPAMSFYQLDVLMHGGFNNGTLGDTWLWDGAAMQWNLVGGRGTGVVGKMVYGRWYGEDGTHWRWSSSGWIQSLAPGTPPPRTDFAMAFDLMSGKDLIMGGRVNGQLTSEVWEYDVTTNTFTLASTPFTPATYSGSAALFYSRQVVVGFGGLEGGLPTNKTWEYSTDYPASYNASSEPGCPNSLGTTPTMEHVNDPWAGTEFCIAMSGLSPSQPAILLFGVQLYANPIDLGYWGAPGCSLFVRPYSPSGIPCAPGDPNCDLLPTGEATLKYTFPDLPLFYGLTFYTQVLQFEPRPGLPPLASASQYRTGVVGGIVGGAIIPPGCN